jgi:hypothetical protein
MDPQLLAHVIKRINREGRGYLASAENVAVDPETKSH